MRSAKPLDYDEKQWSMAWSRASLLRFTQFFARLFLATSLSRLSDIYSDVMERSPSGAAATVSEFVDICTRTFLYKGAVRNV